ncbi:AbrB family transcriptional regulator [Kushneria aurantia]|uniref:AbrB family transcriptional regulator n=1 Tax=Kushneria aurantia TaxID=504092 RepID=A0ABV6G7S0_9GAMM|nr:AbrB family transcriptional regulator [Kushneria aurantia]
MTLPAVPSSALRWSALMLCCALASLLLQFLNMPAGALIGPMGVSILFGIFVGRLALPRVLFKSGQGVIGLLIAQSMTLSVLSTILAEWPAMLLATAITLALSTVVGIGLVRYGGLPGTTAAWGTTPGAASAMVLMAEEANADPRIVAAMQYVRVISVVLAGALVSHWLGVSPSAAQADNGPQWLPAHPAGLAASAALLLVGVTLCDRLLPAGALLGPMFLGSLVQLSGVIELEVPLPVLEIAYACIGIYVGLRFDRETVRNVMHAFKWMLLASLLLIACCALSALLLVKLMQSDFLTLYLATSPGGLDAMTIIALETNADVAIVAALQVLRLFVVILIGPSMARFVARFARDNG